jgi:hypothetical protein
MSFIVVGMNEKMWQGTGWVFYGMVEELSPILQEKSPEIAERFQESYENQFGDVDLSDYLTDEKNKEIFASSVDEAIARIKEKGCSHWHDPSGFEPFLKKVEELKEIT